MITLSLNGYNLTCGDHPDIVKRGGVCMYYKENLSLGLSALLTLINIYYVK